MFYQILILDLFKIVFNLPSWSSIRW